jgi:dephospho-CoA kinase
MGVMNVVAVVGMTGSGKSEVAAVFERHGYARVRFGDITDDEVRKQGLPLNEANERAARESLRNEHGMAAYARLSLPRIDAGLARGSVVVDGLYSWEEYRLLKDHYGDTFKVVAVWSSPAVRYERLGRRKVRPLTLQEAASRDWAEVENLNKGGPIAMADRTIINDGPHAALVRRTEEIIGELP